MYRVSTKEREKFVAAIVEEVVKVNNGIRHRRFPDDIAAEVSPLARRLLRWGRTYGRLAEAQCNGDYPCDNGERKVVFCPKCEGGYVPHSFKGGTCPSCHAERMIADACGALNRLIHPDDCTGPHFWPVFQGDPRGNTVKLKVPSGRSDSWGGEGLCVPTS